MAAPVGQAQAPVVEVSRAQFLAQFQGAKGVNSEDHTSTNLEEGGVRSITSLDMNDCITVFGIAKYEQRIKQIFAYHVTSQTEQNGDDGIEDVLEGYNFEGGRFEFYIIGGNATSIGEGLLGSIRSAIENVFGQREMQIMEELTDLNANEAEEDDYYVSANLQTDGTLTYCRHMGLL
jgi:hypothetical protein